MTEIIATMWSPCFGKRDQVWNHLQSAAVFKPAVLRQQENGNKIECVYYQFLIEIGQVVTHMQSFCNKTVNNW